MRRGDGFCAWRQKGKGQWHDWLAGRQPAHARGVRSSTSEFGFNPNFEARPARNSPRRGRGAAFTPLRRTHGLVRTNSAGRWMLKRRERRAPAVWTFVPYIPTSEFGFNPNSEAGTMQLADRRRLDGSGRPASARAILARAFGSSFREHFELRKSRASAPCGRCKPHRRRRSYASFG